MKTNNIKGFVLSLIALFAFTFVEAQNGGCSQITNETNCPVSVKIYIYDSSANPCPLCNSYNATIPPNSAIGINCGGCMPVCLVEVVVTAVGGSAATGMTDSNTFPPQPISGTPSGCNAATIEYGNYMVGGMFKIKRP